MILVGFPDACQVIAALTKVRMGLPRHNRRRKADPSIRSPWSLTAQRLLIVNPAQHRVQQIWQVLWIGSQASPQELPARRHVSSLQFRSGARSTAALLAASETDSFSREAPHHEPPLPQ